MTINRMLQLLTVLIFLGHMTFWRLHWGWGWELGIAPALEWFCGILYAAGNTSLMWGYLVSLRRNIQ